MKLTAKERVEGLLDDIEFAKEVHGHVQAKGRVDDKTTYVLARDSYMPIYDLVGDFVSSVEFMESIEKDPGVFVLMFDLMSDRKDPKKSVFPPHPTHFLLDKKGVGRWYNIMARYSKTLPLIALVFDKQGASSTFPIAMGDVVIMHENAGMSIGREDVVKRVLGKDESYDELGSAEMHAKVSGSADFVCKTERDMLDTARKFIGYLSDKIQDYSYSKNCDIKRFIPDNPMYVLDMDKLIDEIVDDGSFFEIKRDYAREMITGFARFEGRSAGIVANRSAHKAGLLFAESCDKEREFVELCDKYDIPLVFLADSCGFMVGSEVEQKGIIKAGAKLFKAIANSRMPKLSVAVRRDYTAGVYAMGGGHIADARFVALPSAVITIYSEGVGSMLADDDEKKRRFEEMMKAAKSPQRLLDEGYIDAVVDYKGLRGEIVSFLKDKAQ